MLGLLDLMFGSYSLLIMRIVQVVVATLTAWVCGETAVQLWGKNSKWATFGLTMFIPTLLFFTPQILTETFAAFFCVLVSQLPCSIRQGRCMEFATHPAGESEVWQRAGWWLSDIETDSSRRLQFPSEVELDR